MSRSVILVPLDGSSRAAAALPYAATLARATGAAVRLFAVVESVPPALLTAAETAQDQILAARRQELTEQIEAAAAALSAGGVETEAVVAAGDPADEIVAATSGADIRMTVLATHGRGGMQRLLVGSVADKVMRLSTRPTLLFRPPESPESEETAETVALHRVLVPLDGSSLAEAALAPAVEVAGATGARLLLAHVEPYAAAMWSPEYALATGANLDQELAAATDAYLAEVRGRLPATIDADTIPLRGSPAVELIDCAEREGVDLVVMATHGRGGLRRLVLGSVADRVVRSGIPVLLIRPAAAEEGKRSNGSAGSAKPAHA